LRDIQAAPHWQSLARWVLDSEPAMRQSRALKALPMGVNGRPTGTRRARASVLSFYRNCVTNFCVETIRSVGRVEPPVVKTVLPDEAGLRLIINRYALHRLADTLRGLQNAAGGCLLDNDALRFGSHRAVRRRGQNIYDDAARLALAVVTQMSRDLGLNPRCDGCRICPHQRRRENLDRSKYRELTHCPALSAMRIGPRLTPAR
jgi:hypothetical protein